MIVILGLIVGCLLAGFALGLQLGWKVSYWKRLRHTCDNCAHAEIVPRWNPITGHVAADYCDLDGIIRDKGWNHGCNLWKAK